MMNYLYFWRYWSNSWTISVPTLGLSQFFTIPSHLRVSLGFWTTVVADDILNDNRAARNTFNGKALYQKLGAREIRLLVLDCSVTVRGDASSTSPNAEIALKAKLIHTQLPTWAVDTCQYEALSYVWGPPRLSSSIEIDGVLVGITDSLAKCLRHLQQRTNNAHCVLWIDAICINQDDLDDKSSQVQLMSRIYGNATKVLVWLGPESPVSHIGMDVLRYLCYSKYPSQSPPWIHHSPDIVAKGLSDVMDRQWFQRIWVIQEAVMSKQVQIICGMQHFTWCSSDVTAVRRFIRMIQYAEISPSWEQAGLSEIKLQPLLDMLDMQIGNQLDRAHGSSHRRARDLLDMAHAMRHRLSTDRRDTLFALAGIAEDGYNVENYRPNYRWTTEEAYQHLLETIIFD